MITIVLPAYNEAANIKPLLVAMKRAMEDSGLTDYRIILVNDGSTDGTGEVARSQTDMRIEVLDNEQNVGLAETLKRGLLHAVQGSADDDIIVTMDSDNSHTPTLIMRMVQGIREGNDVVIASRYRYGARTRGLSRARRALSYGASALFRLLLPIDGVRDYTCGYRAYRGLLLRRAFRDLGPDRLISERGFSCMVDILLKMREYDPIITEVPLILRYDKKVGASKMNVARTVGDTRVLIARRRFGVR
jgi:dolichol-phosphate mannosyltransferase